MIAGLLTGMLLGAICTVVTLETLRWWVEFGWNKWMIIPLVLCGLPVLFFTVLVVSISLGVWT